jgi:hypothetical protein
VEHDLPLVTGLCVQRQKPHYPCVYRLIPSDDKYTFLTRFRPGLQQIDACGAACLLIRTDVLRAIPPPWFDWPDSSRGEDIAFCERARAAGFPIVLDFDVRCTHLGVLEATYELFVRETLPNVTFGSEEIARLSQDMRPWPPDIDDGAE